MRSRNGIVALVALAGLAWAVSTATSVLAARAAATAEPALVHSVYFSLHDNGPSAVTKLVDDCKQYLTGHPGTLFFACGTPSDLDRPVNDRAFDVALHIVFDSRAAHDRYQTAPRHLEFVERNREQFKQVRVFDSDVEVALEEN